MSVYVKLWYSGHSGEERGLIFRTAAGNRAYRLRIITGSSILNKLPWCRNSCPPAPCWKLFIHRPYKMLAVLSISMRSLFMQEFSPYICMLVRFNMTKLESFTTVSWRTTRPVSRNSRSCCPTLTVNHSYASQMPFLKRLTVSFLQRVTRASLKNSFHAIGLLSKTRIFRSALRVLLANGLSALKAEIVFQLLISSFTEPYWSFERFSRPSSHSSPAQDRSGTIPGYNQKHLFPAPET